MKYRRHKLERWLDQHNHTMEFVRTLIGCISASGTIIVLAKLFNLI